MNDELKELLTVGNTLLIDCGPNSNSTRTVQICAHVQMTDDDLHIAFRSQSASGSWHYQIKWIGYFEGWFKDGQLKTP